MKVKRTATAFLCILFTCILAFSFITAGHAAIITVAGLFNLNGVNVSTNSTAEGEARYGVRLTAVKNEASADIKNIASGEMQMEFRLFDNGQQNEFSIVFEDAVTGESVSAIFEKVDSGYHIYGAGDGFAGIETNALYGVSHVITFSPEKRAVVYGIGSSAVSLFTSNHGYADYKISFQFGASDTSVLIYSIGGQSLPSLTITDEASPLLFADTSVPAVVGRSYSVPVPHAYDVSDGGISAENVTVSVARDGIEIISSQKYNENLSFVPESIGVYNVTYQVGDTAGRIVNKSYQIHTLSSDGYTSSVYSQDIVDVEQTIGTGSEIYVPEMRVTNTYLSVSDMPTVLTVMLNGDIVSEFYPSDSRFTFEDSGYYQFIYQPIIPQAGDPEIVSYYVSDEQPKVSYAKFDREYVTGNTISIPELTMELGGNTYNTTSVIVNPDGTSSVSKEIILEQSGKYIVEYRATIGGKLYAHKKAFVASSPMYELSGGKGNVSYGYSQQANGQNGIKVSLEPGSEFVYNKAINLSELTDDDPLFTIYITPEKEMTQEFQQIIVTLTDKADPNNTLRIMANASTDASSKYPNHYHIAYYKAGFNDQPAKGLEGSKIHVEPSTWGAYNSTTCFWGLDGNFPVQAYFHKSENAVYIIHNNAKRLVIDLDDPTYFSELWSGFKSDEVYLTVSANSYVGTTANFVITDIFGEDLAKSVYPDNTPPEITVNRGDYQGMPEAIVGSQFKFFGATAEDYIDGATPVSARVYMYYGTVNQTEIYSAQGIFTPAVTGTYTVEYRSMDKSGNVGIATVEIIAKESLSAPLTIHLLGDGDAFANAGVAVKVQTPSVTGGSGPITIKAEAVYGEYRYTVEDGQFIPQYAGEYTIIYTASDYIGNTTVQSYKIIVDINDELVITQDIVAPSFLIDGVAATLPDLVVTDYKSGSPEDVQVDIYVSDQKGDQQKLEGLIYTPAVTNSGDTVTIVYKVGDLELKEFQVVVQKAGSGDIIDMTGYFMKQGNISVSADEEKITLSPKENGAGFLFINKLLAENFTFIFDVNAAKNNFNEVVFWLTDSENPLQRVKIVIRRSSARALISINDGEEYTFTGSFTGGSSYRFNLNFVNSECRVSDAAGLSFPVSQTFSGEAFTGFESGFVNLQAEFPNVTGDAEIYVYSVNGQLLSSSQEDLVAPQITVSGSLGGQKQLGEVVTIYSAIAGDVLSLNTDLALRVTGPDGVVTAEDGTVLNGVPCDRNYTIKLTSYGVYRAEYTASPATGPMRVYRQIVEAVDSEAPVISLNGNAPSSGNAGKSLSVPGITVTDGGSTEITVFMMYIDPKGVIHSITNMTATCENGSCTIQGNKFTPSEKGEYTVRYMAIDTRGNLGFFEFDVTIR